MLQKILIANRGEIASSANVLCNEFLSASEYTATVLIPISLHALIILTAISPLFAINIMYKYLSS